MNLKKIFATSLLLILFCTPGFSEDYVDSFQLLSTRSMSLGGIHSTDTHDIGVLFNNPAGFQAVEPQLAFSEITLGLSGPVFDIANLVVEGLSGGDLMGMLGSDSAQDMLTGIYTGLDLIGPVYFGYVGNGLGLGIFNNTDVTIQETAPLTLGITLTEEVLLCGGYTFRVPLPEDSGHTLDLGLLLKGGIRGSVEITESILNIMNIDFGTDMLLENPFSYTASIGLDTGVLYNYGDIVSVGVTFMDLFSPSSTTTYTGLDVLLDGTGTATSTSTGTVPISMNVGLGVTPPLGFLDKYISELALYVDFNDVLGVWLYQENYTNPWLHLSVGAELTLLEIFALRAGLNEGLLSAGLGLDLTLFQLNLAMYGSELGTEPGVQPVYNLMIGFEFRY